MFDHVNKSEQYKVDPNAIELIRNFQDPCDRNLKFQY